MRTQRYAYIRTNIYMYMHACMHTESGWQRKGSGGRDSENKGKFVHTHMYVYILTCMHACILRVAGREKEVGRRFRK